MATQPDLTDGIVQRLLDLEDHVQRLQKQATLANLRVEAHMAGRVFWHPEADWIKTPFSLREKSPEEFADCLCIDPNDIEQYRREFIGKDRAARDRFLDANGPLRIGGLFDMGHEELEKPIDDATTSSLES